jgi:ASC-1-like (ASCH) protein
LARRLWVKEEYLQQIVRGEKTIEVRVGYPNILRLKAGDEIRFNDRHSAIIQRIAYYRTFEQLLEAENAEAIGPGLSAEALLSAPRSIYPPEKEALGVVALELVLACASGLHLRC